MSEHAEEVPSGKKPAELDWVKLVWEIIKGVTIAVAAIFSFFANQSVEKVKAIKSTKWKRWSQRRMMFKIIRREICNTSHISTNPLSRRKLYV